MHKSNNTVSCDAEERVGRKQLARIALSYILKECNY